MEFSWGLILHKNTNLDSKQTWLICCPKGQAFSEFLTVAPVKKQKPASQRTQDALEYFWSFYALFRTSFFGGGGGKENHCGIKVLLFQL